MDLGKLILIFWILLHNKKVIVVLKRAITCTTFFVVAMLCELTNLQDRRSQQFIKTIASVCRFNKNAGLGNAYFVQVVPFDH